MRAKVTTDFDGVLDGEIYPQTFLIDDEITGDLARTAVAAGNATILEDDTKEEKNARRRRIEPLPPQPNNPPSPAAVGTAGLPPATVQLSAPTPGTETSLPAIATVDNGASTIEGPDTPTGGKLADGDADLTKPKRGKTKSVDLEMAQPLPESGDPLKTVEVEQKSPALETQKVDGPDQIKVTKTVDTDAQTATIEPTA
jgi:hypothetical protein